jgi:glycosyltransferase involved in cell wall biosynthesis
MSSLPLTVALCTRDRPELLRRALASLALQSPAPAEILVVDNAPRDGCTRQIVEEMEQVAARYLVEPVPGLDFARNRALAAASQDVVAFLDDDAVAEPGWAAALLAPFADPEVGAVTGRVDALATETEAQRLFEANGGYARGEERIRLPRDAGRSLHGRRAPRIAWAVSVGSGCSLAVRRRLLLDLGGFDEALDLGPALPGGGDHDALWRVLEAGADVVYEPAARARHEHRRDLAAVQSQITGHQRALVAFLTKSLLRAEGLRSRRRLGLLAFLAWRLVKPLARLARRAAGRDPLPAGVLLRMAGECWAGLWAYPLARRAARRRKALAWETLTPIPSPTRTHTRPGEGRHHPEQGPKGPQGLQGLQGQKSQDREGGGSPSPGRRECGWERGPGGEGPASLYP